MRLKNELQRTDGCENQILEDIKQNEIIDFGLARISLREATKENREGFLKRLLYFVLQTKTFKH